MTVQIALSRGLFALVDDDDYPRLAEYRWFAAKGGKGFYAVTSSGISMHRLLTGAAVGLEVDHKNGDGLDNRRANIRVCSHKENLRNKKKQPNTTSRFKGVYLSKSGSWRAVIEQNGQKLHLGSFKSEFKAARQYDRAARVLFGQFAKTNESLGLFDGASDRLYVPRERIKPAKRVVRNAFADEMQRIGITPRFTAVRH